jgi:hypothetical protein
MFKYKRWPRLKAIAKSLRKGAGVTAACEAAHMIPWTLARWRKEDPKVNEFIEKVLNEQIQIVEGALLKRAVGYKYEETTKEGTRQRDGTTITNAIKIVTKEVAPDPTSAIFYLMNREPKRWADKRALVNNIIANINNSGREKLKDIPTPLLKRMLEYANNGHDTGDKPGSDNGNGTH